MKKVLASVVLGFALLAPGGRAVAQGPRPAEPRWGIRPERRAPKLLDFASWVSRRVGGPFSFLAVEDEPEIVPEPLPVPDPGSGDSPDVTCPDRKHCPIG